MCEAANSPPTILPKSSRPKSSFLRRIWINSLIGGDYNSKSPERGEARLDGKGILIGEMVTRNDLIITLSDHRCIEFNLEQPRQAVDKGRGSEGRSPSWKTRRFCRVKLRVHLETTRLIDELAWGGPAGSLEDTVRSARQKVVAACDYSVPRHKRRQAKNSMYLWNDPLMALRGEFLATRRKFTCSKGDAMLHEAWKGTKAALRRCIKKSQLQCWKNLIGEVEKDPQGLAFKIVTKGLVTRRKTPGLDNPD